MSKFQIEKVDFTNVYDSHTCCVIDYHPYTDTVAQINYVHEQSGRKNKTPKSVGMWKIKKYEF